MGFSQPSTKETARVWQAVLENPDAVWTIEHLALEAGCSVAKARRAIWDLEEAKLIRVYPQDV